MIVSVEMQGLNDTRPFMLTWEYQDKFFSIDIEKNITRADLEAGWNAGKGDDQFHITLEPKEMEEENLTEADNGEHRYWKISIILTSGDKPQTVGSGSCSWGEFFVID